MKIFKWVHRKLGQKYTQVTHEVDEEYRTSHASLVDLLPSEQFSGVKAKCRTKAAGSAFKVVQNNVKVNEEEKCKEIIVKNYFHRAVAEEEGNDRSVQAAVVSDGLLAIGTFGLGNLESLHDVVVGGKDEGTDVDDDVEVEDVEELRTELEKVLYIASSDGAAAKANTVNVKSKKDVNASEKRGGAEAEKEGRGGRKVFPLRDFLEIPQAPSEAPVLARRKSKKMGTFSNLLNIKAFLCGYEKNLLHDIVDHHKKRTDSFYFLNRVLHNSKPPLLSNSTQMPSYKLTGVTDKLLRFRKKWVSWHNSENSNVSALDRHSNLLLLRGSKDNEESNEQCKVRQEKNVICNNTKNDNANINHDHHGHDQFQKVSFKYLQEDDRNGGFKFNLVAKEESNEEEWCSPPRKEDYSLKDNTNDSDRDEYEYWIKTDDEYVVLEL